MEITRNVILDLMPLYLANEVSEDTRALVEEYLKKDPQLEKVARQTASEQLSSKVPAPSTQNGGLKAYSLAKRALIWRTIVLAAIISIILIIILMLMYFTQSSSTIMDFVD